MALALEPDQHARQAEQFATLICCHGLRFDEACTRMGIRARSGQLLMQSAAYSSLEAQLIETMGISPGRTPISVLEDKLAGLTPLALLRHQGILAESKNESVVMRAAEGVYDRVGLAKVQRHDHKGSFRLQLDETTIGLLAETAREMLAGVGAIELPKSDWSYATERPTDERDRATHASRGDARALPHSGDAVDLLHGEGGLRVPGPRRGPARDDGGVDPAPDEEEAGFSPASASEDDNLDDR